MTDTEQIKQKIDIVAFINEHAPLKKIGRNFRANCPFHSEKTPSFYVSPDRQVWHCFGCAKGGDLFTFLMEYEHIDFPEALRTLAERAGVTLTERFERTQEQKLRERLYELQHLASEYYHYILTKHKLGEQARTYLANRKVRSEIVETFMLGYAPNSWDSTGNYLRKKGFTDQELLWGGLVVEGRMRGYDRFRGRLVFPIHDHRGKVVAFAGRLLDPNIKEAKYINSPETSIYVKGETLYGLDKSKEAIRKANTTILVEGEFDYLSSFSDGVTNVVAIKGTALTQGQIALLKRFTDKLIFALDSDLAGDAAARRGIELADKAGFLMKVVELPEGKDPDECVKAGAGLWKKAVSRAVPIYDYFLSSSLSRFDPATIEGKTRVSEELVPVLARIENPIVQAHYIRLLAQKLDVPEDTVREAVNRQIKLVKATAVTHVTPPQELPKPSREEQLEELMLALILQIEDRGELETLVGEIGIDDFSLPVLGKIWQMVHTAVKPHAKLPLFEGLKAIPAELAPTLDRLVLLEVNRFQESKKVQVELLREFKRMVVRRKIRLLATKMRQVQESEDEAEVARLNTELAQLTQVLKTIDAT